MCNTIILVTLSFIPKALTFFVSYLMCALNFAERIKGRLLLSQKTSVYFHFPHKIKKKMRNIYFIYNEFCRVNSI